MVHSYGPLVLAEPVDRSNIGVDIDMGKEKFKLEISTAGEGPSTRSTSASTSISKPVGASTLPYHPIVVGFVSAPHEFV